MNDRTATNAVKTVLQANLEDPRAQYTNTDRAWLHTDEPLAQATFPRIQIRKGQPSIQEIIGMNGFDFKEQRVLFLDVQMWSKAPFKWKGTDNLYLQDEELLKEWQDKIWLALKANQQTTYQTYGITGLKLTYVNNPYMEPDTQLYTSTVQVRLWYFISGDCSS